MHACEHSIAIVTHGSALHVGMSRKKMAAQINVLAVIAVMLACLLACVHACVRACMRACVRLQAVAYFRVKNKSSSVFDE